MARYKTKKNTKKGRVAAAMLAIIASIIFMTVILMPRIKKTAASYSSEVESYDAVIREYAGQYGMSEYVDLIKAVMMQESKGKGPDPMQSSESSYNLEYERVANGIKDPDYSIKCGIQYLKESLDLAGCRDAKDLDAIKLAVQGYNYGHGYINWAMERDGGYTAENASIFSDNMAREMNWKRYGDKDYVPHVLRYYTYIS